MKYAVIIKHPFRDHDYRVDLIDVPKDVPLKDIVTVIERSMLGPFEVLAITTTVQDRDISEHLKKLSLEVENHIE